VFSVIFHQTENSIPQPMNVDVKKDFMMMGFHIFAKDAIIVVEHVKVQAHLIAFHVLI
jgi:hypothetical protein